MTFRQKVARNVIWNWAGTAANMVVGFVVFPVLIARLGESDCGLWLLIVSLTGYFDLLDLGLRGSLGRNIAFFRARGDADGVNSVFNTGLTLLAFGSVLVLLATVLIQTVFFDLFDVRLAAQPDVRSAIWLIGLNLALIFLFNSFESVLWGHERFDLLNCVDIPCVLLRAGLTIALVGTGSEHLVTLALIILAVTVLRGAGLAFFAAFVNRGLRLGRRFVRFDTTRHLFDFGIWMFLLSVSNVISQQLGPTLTGMRFRTALVTQFSAAARLVGYVRTVLMNGTGVLTPQATAWHAAEEHAKQRWLFVNGGKVCLALALFFLGGFWFLGDRFLWLWTGEILEYAWPMLMILMLGELLPLSQWITFGTVIGMNRHRLWAVMSLVEVVLIVGLAVLFLQINDSILSIALAIAIPGALCRGLIQMVYACWILKVPLAEYVRRALLPPLAGAAGPMLLLAALASWHAPQNWFELIAFALIYAAAYALSAGVLVIGPAVLKRVLGSLWQRSRAAAPEAAAPVPDVASLDSGTGAPVLR